MLIMDQLSDDERYDLDSDDDLDDRSTIGGLGGVGGGRLCVGSQAEKRAHHNALERKRRDHIKDSFCSLRDTIPTLQGEKSSRAQILKKAADYIQYMRKKNSAHLQDIEDLRQQNGQLGTQIRSLDVAGGGGGGVALVDGVAAADAGVRGVAGAGGPEGVAVLSDDSDQVDDDEDQVDDDVEDDDEDIDDDDVEDDDQDQEVDDDGDDQEVDDDLQGQLVDANSGRPQRIIRVTKNHSLNDQLQDPVDDDEDIDSHPPRLQNLQQQQQQAVRRHPVNQLQPRNQLAQRSVVRSNTVSVHQNKRARRY